MIYRLAKETDIDKICSLVESAVRKMEIQQIFQWDNLYPTKADFLDDVQKQQLFIGMSNNDISLVYVLNKDSDKEYENGAWKYPNSEYRIIHRLCVNPEYQNRGIAKSTLIHIEKELREMGIETIRLDVFSNNPFALSLYQNNGYKKGNHTG